MTRQHYASTGIIRSIRQVMYVLRNDENTIAKSVAVRAERLRRDEARIACAFGHELTGLDILIIGPGPYLVEPRFFGQHNNVTAIDLDEIPIGFAPGPYFRMLRQNGFGRFAKTVGRKIIGVDRRNALAWQRELGTTALPRPRLIQGDILKGSPQEGAYDVVACWSVFQHLPDPALAIRQMKAALRPGGVIYFGLHLYTSNTGHHDIRAFTGGALSLPPWGHLRASTKNEVRSSAWLNQWRLRDWRSMLDEYAPGYEEYRQTYGEADSRQLLNPDIRAELADFDDEELLTVDVFFLWKKPKA